MGWGYCGKDSKGRDIGYTIPATCDHPGCNEKIDRGLSYVCGRMHGDDEYSCEKYFCEKHRSNYLITDQDEIYQVCSTCRDELIQSGEWYENIDGELVRVEE